ncbi:MAG: hypothetical protein AB7I25_02765 [Vicinamibacterales bacterium]
MELSRPSLLIVAAVASISAIMAGRIIWLLLEDPLRLLRLFL